MPPSEYKGTQLPLLRPCWHVMPLQSEPPGLQVLQELPPIGTALPVVMDSAAVPSTGLPQVGDWVKIKVVGVAAVQVCCQMACSTCCQCAGSWLIMCCRPVASCSSNMCWDRACCILIQHPHVCCIDDKHMLCDLLRGRTHSQGFVVPREILQGQWQVVFGKVSRLTQCQPTPAFETWYKTRLDTNDCSEWPHDLSKVATSCSLPSLPRITIRQMMLKAAQRQPGPFRVQMRLIGHLPQELLQWCKMRPQDSGAEPVWEWAAHLWLEDATGRLLLILAACAARRCRDSVEQRFCSAVPGRLIPAGSCIVLAMR